MGATGWARMLEGRVLAGRYAIERQVGEGGMGAVFSGTQLAVQRRVAIKVLLPSVADDGSAAERFHREATLVATIARRGVPQIIDFDRDPVAGPFVVMELLSGESLADRLKRHDHLHPREAAEIAAAMLETLEVVHAQGVVHRDLKPANVFLAKDGPGGPSVKILDFGVARVCAPSGDLTAQGVLLGTPRYMAPEQAAGDRGVDARADLYAVGAVLYACLAGRPPYAGLTGDDVLVAVREGPPLSLAEVSPGLAPALVAVVDRAMARSAEARFRTAAQMREALAASVADLPELPPPSAGPASSPTSGQATVQDHAPPLEHVEPPATAHPDGTDGAVVPSTRTPSRAARQSAPRRPTAVRVGVALIALAALSVAALLAVRTSTRASLSVAASSAPGVASAPASDDRAPAALLEQLRHARSEWRAGDAAHARATLEGILREVDETGVRARSPAARVAAESLLLLGDLDEKAIAAPATPEPTSMHDLGPETMTAARQAGMRAESEYARVSQWGALDLVVCSSYRSGRTSERLESIARSAEARDLARMRRPAIEGLYPGGVPMLEAGWSASLSSYRAAASAFYDAAVSTARFVDGAAVDPADGGDCRAMALARRDALADGGR